MESFFHDDNVKEEFPSACDVSAAPRVLAFATLTSDAEPTCHQSDEKDAFWSDAVQDYVSSRWKDQHNAGVMMPTGSPMHDDRQNLYNNGIGVMAAQDMLLAQQSIVNDLHTAVTSDMPRDFLPNSTSSLQLCLSTNSDHSSEGCQISQENSYFEDPLNQTYINKTLFGNYEQESNMVMSTGTKSEECSFTAQIVQAFLWIEAKLCAKLKTINFSDKVAYIYNPLEYASAPHAHYVSKYIGTKTILFLGMNPGPFGMAQNGVPFGDSRYVRDWLKISGPVQHPPREHPRRIIQGMDCTRSEVSGARFWGYMAKICGTPEQFFRNSFVHNYCPLVFMTKTGKNMIPAALPACERHNLEAVCDEALLQCIRVIRAQIVVAVGKYAADRADFVLRNAGDESAASIRIERILHPSPASPQANRGWEEIVHQQLEQCGVMQYLISPG